jgi:hypothetical protein
LAPEMKIFIPYKYDISTVQFPTSAGQWFRQLKKVLKTYFSIAFEGKIC